MGRIESGYNKTDAQLNYQYRAFPTGVDLSAGSPMILVIAPMPASWR